MFDVFSGGALSRSAIFLLNIMPYITASIIIQLLTSVVPTLENLRKEGEQGRKQLNQYTRYLTVLIATIQSTLTAQGLNSSALEPGWFFQLTTVISLVGGTMSFMAGRTDHSARHRQRFLAHHLRGHRRRNADRALPHLGTGPQRRAVPCCHSRAFRDDDPVVTVVVFFERAQRRLTIQYPKRQIGNRMFQGDSSHLPLKLNASGVIPPIFASTLLYLPATVEQFMGRGSDELTRVLSLLGPGQPLHILFYMA